MACLPKLMEYFLKLMEIFSKLMAYFLKLAVHLRFGYKDTTSALRFTNTSRIIFFLCIFLCVTERSAVIWSWSFWSKSKTDCQIYTNK